MPDRSDRLLEAAERADAYELPYVSKSRVMQWMKNPEHFRLKYLEDIREPETEAMRRGTNVHEIFESYYEEVSETESFEVPELARHLPDDHTSWSRYVVPYLVHFASFEANRWKAASDLDEFKPVAIEEERWRDDIIEDGPEWMGIADAVYHAGSIPWVDEDEGVVIVDFKTGKVPNPRYREDGIYTELAYYELLFEDKYDVVAGAAYYPKANETVVRKPVAKHKNKAIGAAREMITACDEYDGEGQFEAKEGPLCRWSFDDDDESALYGVCSQCTWAVPANNEQTFRQLVEEGYSDREIADELGTSSRASSYWRRKL